MSGIYVCVKLIIVASRNVMLRASHKIFFMLLCSVSYLCFMSVYCQVFLPVIHVELTQNFTEN